MRETNSLSCPRFRWFAIHKAKAQYQIIKVKYNEQLFNTLITTHKSNRGEVTRRRARRPTLTPTAEARSWSPPPALPRTPPGAGALDTGPRATPHAAAASTTSHTPFLSSEIKSYVCDAYGRACREAFSSIPAQPVYRPGLAKGRRQAQAPLEMRFY